MTPFRVLCEEFGPGSALLALAIAVLPAVVAEVGEVLRARRSESILADRLGVAEAKIAEIEPALARLARRVRKLRRGAKAEAKEPRKRPPRTPVPGSGRRASR